MIRRRFLRLRDMFLLIQSLSNCVDMLYLVVYTAVFPLVYKEHQVRLHSSACATDANVRDTLFTHASWPDYHLKRMLIDEVGQSPPNALSDLTDITPGLPASDDGISVLCHRTVATKHHSSYKSEGTTGILRVLLNPGLWRTSSSLE